MEEYVIIGTKQYWRQGEGPWSINPRKPFPMSDISGCKYLGEEPVDTRQTLVYQYDRRFASGVARVRMWVEKATGLRVKAHFNDINPTPDSFERSYTYFFGDNIREPI
ncbi:hypothetical protein ACLJYM_27165 [Rhizobium giardinii]|uniref:hypothetical protein n=1 Tax=Rhizobium giardinii TaxID=56731 RepID=UPI0013AF3FCB